MNLGHTLRKLRQWDAAIECYLQALGLKPGQVRCPPGATCLQQGLSFARHCKLPDWLPCCMLARPAFPTVPAASHSLPTCACVQPGTYSALGYAHHLKGDYNAAIENYHKVWGRAAAAVEWWPAM